MSKEIQRFPTNNLKYFYLETVKAIEILRIIVIVIK